MPSEFRISATNDSLALNAYRGDSSVLLAFNLKPSQTQNLAGFAIECVPPLGSPYWMLNRLNFQKKLDRDTAPQQREWAPSNEAPFQKFRWVDFVRGGSPGRYTYRGTAMYFTGVDSIEPGPTVEVTLSLGLFSEAALQLGFTRGFLSSQAYAARFKNAPIRPPGKGLLFDTSAFRARYEWLGYHGRDLLFQTLDECVSDESTTVDVFAYDLDEPDVVRKLARLGKRLRIILDNAKLHTKQGARERESKQLLITSAGPENVHVGHFQRFAHDKVIIEKKDGVPVKVLTGSANFSVRGLYVQANSVLVFTDSHAASLYEEAFDQAWQSMSDYPSSKVASQWFAVGVGVSPKTLVSFAPHESAAVSLDKVADEITKADRSVLYAVMQLGGGGPVMEALQELRGRSRIFSYGVTQAAKHLTVFKPGDIHGGVVTFSFLKDQVPLPFRKEWSGGAGQVIHHKFVVSDFNDSDPVLFTGSSNLSKGGEEENGDNLLAVYDRDVATAYAVEALRLVDHYHFRAALRQATKATPLVLQNADAPKKWWEPYYDPENIKFHDRELFVNPRD